MKKRIPILYDIQRERPYYDSLIHIPVHTECAKTVRATAARTDKAIKCITYFEHLSFDQAATSTLVDRA